MPAIAALTIKDGVGAGADHTFSPVTTTGSRAQWADRSPVTPAGFRILNHEVSGPSANRESTTVTLGVYNPREAVVDGSTVVTSRGSAKVTLNFAPDSTLQERKDLLAYTANFLSNASVKASVDNLEPFY